MGDVLVRYSFVAPFFVLFGVFGALPLAISLVMSLVEWNGLTVEGFAGTENFAAVLEDPTFHRALANTAVIWLQVPLTLSAAFLLAIALDSSLVRGRHVLRITIFSPVIMSLVAAGLLFNLLLDARFGLANLALGWFGLGPIDWRGNDFWTKPALIVLTLWRWTGYYMMIMLAGLQSIDRTVHEAARVDGSDFASELRYITLPLMKPVIGFAAIVATVGSLAQFEQILVMFGQSGGIKESALTTGLLIYRRAFGEGNFGYGAALSWILGVIIVVLVVIQLRAFRSST